MIRRFRYWVTLERVFLIGMILIEAAILARMLAHQPVWG